MSTTMSATYSTTTMDSTNISTHTSPLVDVCPPKVPTSTYYLHEVAQDPTKLTLFTLCGVLSFMTLIIYAYEMAYLLQNKMNVLRRVRMVALLSLYPVYSLLSLLAILVPRAATLMDLVANVYFAFTLWHFMQLLVMYYGGEKKMIETFSLESTQISIQTPPLCCFFPCLPKFPLTKSFLKKLKLGATQFLILRPVLLVVSMILWVEDGYDYIDPQTGILMPFQSPSTYISLVNMTTTLLAMWSMIILFRASIQPLGRYHVRGKFIVFQLVMVFGNLQDAILTQLASFNLITCTYLLPVKSWALEIHHMIIIGEMFILGVAALAVYWRYIRENIPLDHFNGHGPLRRSSSDSEAHEEVTTEDDTKNFVQTSAV